MYLQLSPEHRDRLARLLPLITLAVMLIAVVTQYILALRRHHAEMRLYRDLAEAARSGRTSLVFNAAHFSANAEHAKLVVRPIPAATTTGLADGAKAE